MTPPATEKALLALGDTIKITFTPEYGYVPPSSWSGKVDTQGNVTGIFGQFQVAGLTLEEAAQKIERVASLSSREWGHGAVSVKVSR